MRIHRVRRLGAVLLALVLAGCWQQAGGGPDNTRFNAIENDLTRDNVTSLAERWRTPVDGFVTEPLVSGNDIYVATRKNQDGGQGIAALSAQAYDRSTGALVWQRSLAAAGGTQLNGDVATPAVVDGALWVPYWQDGLGPCAGQLVRLDPDTGAVLSSDATGTGPSALVVAGDRVAYTEGCEGNVGGVQLVVRDKATRAVQWTFHFPAGASVTPPTIADGRVYLATGQSLYAFALDGCGAATCNPLWTKTGVGTVFDFLRITAGPNGSLVTVGHPADNDFGSTIVVRDGATGDVRWTADARYGGSLPGEITGWAVAYDTLYVAGMPVGSSANSPAGILDAYPIGGCGQPVCSPAWTVDLGASRPAREPTVAAGVVYVPMVPTSTVAGAMVAVDAHGCGAATCAEVTRVPLTAGPGAFFQQAQPYVTSVGAGRLLVGWMPPSAQGAPPTDLISFGPAGD